MALTWRQFADENPSAAADLRKQLAEIARSEPPHQGAIARALTDAGFSHRRCDNARSRPQFAQHFSLSLADWKSSVPTTASTEQVTWQPSAALSRLDKQER
jgi:hypothetical protein